MYNSLKVIVQPKKEGVKRGIIDLPLLLHNRGSFLKGYSCALNLKKTVYSD
jgi:hypothetical protein